MNIFRFAGDMSHAMAILLLLKMAKKGQASGISLKSQELYLIVFITRYLDIFTVFYSLYNSIMKVFFISSTAVIIYLLKCSERWHTSYNPTHDNFLHWRYIMLPTFGLGWLTHFIWGRNLNLMEGLWCVSIYLEAVAMLPQLIMFRSDRILKGNQGDVKDEILLPIFLLGIYRGLYIINWIYRAITERNYRHHLVVYTCGIVQVLLYSSFFKVFCKSTVCPTTTASDDAIDGLEYSPLVDVNNDDNSSVDAEEVFDGVSQLLGEFSVEKSNADVRSSDMGHNGTIKTDNTGDAV